VLSLKKQYFGGLEDRPKTTSKGPIKSPFGITVRKSLFIHYFQVILGCIIQNCWSKIDFDHSLGQSWTLNFTVKPSTINCTSKLNPGPHLEFNNIQCQILKFYTPKKFEYGEVSVSWLFRRILERGLSLTHFKCPCLIQILTLVCLHSIL
jgi:hypothetical protein